jgi:hypothetical protein
MARRASDAQTSHQSLTEICMPRLTFAPFAVAPRPHRTHATGTRRLADAAAAVAPELLCGPGWFDSSWELRAGLEVHEGLPEDIRLDEWVDAFCVGERRSDLALAAA